MIVCTLCWCRLASEPCTKGSSNYMNENALIDGISIDGLK